MPQPLSHYARCAGHEIHFLEWGASDAPAVIAWHGLARTGRDMDDLAEHLSDRWRVICPDTIGRGLSQWSRQPQQDYCLDGYLRMACDLADALDLKDFDWVGTSMGGALGLVAAAGPLRHRIRRLVMNDIGPQLEPLAVQRIRDYAGQPPAFDSVTELEAFFRQVYRPYGWLSDAQWRRLAETSVRRLPDGRLTPHYDPAIVAQFIHHPQDYDRWPEWEGLNLPVLCLRGEHSDLLSAVTAQAMVRRQPLARLVTIPDCGHAPALNTPAQWHLVREFLLGER